MDGAVDLRIPAGTQPGTTLVMAKRGVPRLGQDNLRGDHQVHVRVTIPSAARQGGDQACGGAAPAAGQQEQQALRHL